MKKNGKKAPSPARPQAAPRRRAGRRRFLTALLLLGAVLTGFFLPNLFDAFQNLRTDRMSERVDLGEETLSLTSSESRLERLRAIRDYDAYGALGIADPIAITDRSRLFLTEEEVAGKFAELAALLDGTGLSMGGLTGEDLGTPEAVMLVVGDINGAGISSNAVWIAHAGRSIQRDNGSSFSYDLFYAVDDVTGMLLAASYTESGIYSGGSFRTDASWLSTAAQTLAERFRESAGLTDLSLDLDLPGEGEINPYLTVCYVNFQRGRETLYSMPLSFGDGRWGLNITNNLR